MSSNSEEFEDIPSPPFKKGRNSPLWPPAHRASGPEGKEGLGEIFRRYLFSIIDSLVNVNRKV